MNSNYAIPMMVFGLFLLISPFFYGWIQKRIKKWSDKWIEEHKENL